MKIALVIVLFGLLFASGCAAAPARPRPAIVWIDASFGGDVVAVVAAVDAWNEAAPELQLVATVVDRQSAMWRPLDREAPQIHVIRAADDAPCPIYGGIGGALGEEEPSGRVCVNVPLLRARGDDITETAAHEIGHGLGLGHDVEGTLMCATDTCSAARPTSRDVATLRALGVS